MLFLFFSFYSSEARDKFEFLYEKYKKLLLHKAFEILRDHQLAEDATNETFIRVYRNLHKINLDEPGRTASFLVTILKNVSFTLYRKEKRTEADLLSEEREDDFQLEDHVISAMSAENIYKLLDRLNDDLKSVFLLKYGHDLSHKEIGKMLGISENNVTVRLHRAKKKIHDLLVKEGQQNA